MLGMNLWGTIYNTIYMFGWPQASGYEAVQFCQQHPEAAWDIFFYCLCGAVGQNFIFLTISRFGSLTNTTITTTRKFVSIVVSSLLSGNPLSPIQWGSVVMVFSGLSYQIYLKWQKLQRLQKKRKTTWTKQRLHSEFSELDSLFLRPSFCFSCWPYLASNGMLLIARDPVSSWGITRKGRRM